MRSFSGVDLLLLAMVLVWSANFAVIKAALAEFDPLAFNGLRFLLASSLIFGLLWLWRRDCAIRGADLLRLVPLAIVGNALYQVCFIQGMALTRAGDATLILAITPLSTLLLTAVRRTERVHFFSGLGLALSFLGVVLVVFESRGVATPNAADPLLGDLLILGCVFCWSVYTVFSVKLLARYGSLKFTAYTMLIGTLVLAPLGLSRLQWADLALVSPQAWGGLIFSAAGALVFSYVAWYYGVKKLGNARTAAYSNLVPPLALVIAWIFLDEQLGWGHLAGMVVILAGLTLARRAPRVEAVEPSA